MRFDFIHLCLDPSKRIQFYNILRTVYHSITSLNLYKSRIQHDENLPRQRLTTHVFILLLLIALIVSGIYIFFSIQTQVMTIAHPSLDTYTKLYDNYSSTLVCPCSQISVPYSKFLSINYTLHQICSSTLVSSAWLKVTLDFDQEQFANTSADVIVDFRRVAPSYFQLLATVCSLIQSTFNDALDTLARSQFINQYLPSKSQFLEKTTSLNQSFTNSLEQDFLSMQNWLYLVTTQSQLLIGLALNGRLTSEDNDDIVRIWGPPLGLFGTITETSISLRGICSCRRMTTLCQVVSVLSAVSSNETYPERYFVGMNAGCFPWLGILATNINWWYRTDIIEQIRLLFGDHLRNQSDPIITPLSNQTKTRFRYNGSFPLFRQLLAEALLEDWDGNLTRFDLFYEQCAPKECNYLIKSERPHLTAFLLLISICGGLNRILRWFTLLLILSIFYVTHSCHHRRRQGKHLLLVHETCVCNETFRYISRSLEYHRKHASISAAVESVSICSDR